MKPNPEVLGIVEGLVPQARSGDVRAIYVLARLADGSYAHSYYTDDIGDMRYELGSEVMRMGCE